MFIKDGVYREIDVKVDAPIAEGTILTFGGALAAEDASDAFGIVPENIYVLPPTKKIRVVIGGTIDLDDPANKGVEFSDAVVKALGMDINFVPAKEVSEPTPGIPAYNSSDAGKVLAVSNGGTGLEWTEGGSGGGTVYSPVLAQTTKSVVSGGLVSGFAGGPILENANYRAIVNGTTYEPLTGTAGEDGYICLGNTYVSDSDPAGDYSFGIFYKNSQLSAWLETGDSMTMQIDQIIQAVPVPTPAAADTGKVLTANNGAVEWDTINVVPDGEAGENGFYLSLDNSLRPIWQQSVAVFDTTISGSVYTFNSTWQVVKNRFMAGLAYVRIENDICAILAVREHAEGHSYLIRVAMNFGLIDFATDTPLGYPYIDLD